MLEGALSDRIRSELMKVWFDENDDARVEKPMLASVIEKGGFDISGTDLDVQQLL